MIREETRTEALKLALGAQLQRTDGAVPRSFSVNEILRVAAVFAEFLSTGAIPIPTPKQENK